MTPTNQSGDDCPWMGPMTDPMTPTPDLAAPVEEVLAEHGFSAQAHYQGTGQWVAHCLAATCKWSTQGEMGGRNAAEDAHRAHVTAALVSRLGPVLDAQFASGYRAAIAAREEYDDCDERAEAWCKGAAVGHPNALTDHSAPSPASARWPARTGGEEAAVGALEDALFAKGFTHYSRAQVARWVIELGYIPNAQYAELLERCCHLEDRLADPDDSSKDRYTDSENRLLGGREALVDAINDLRGIETALDAAEELIADAEGKPFRFTETERRRFAIEDWLKARCANWRPGAGADD